MKRSITFNFQFSIFSLLMFLFVFTAQGAWAQSGNWKDYAASGYASGSGTIDDPYIIKTADQLAYMAKQINAVVQTNDGYMWVGTYSGLYQYDGIKFKETGIDERIRNVMVLYVDSRGKLWIGTNDMGVFCYDTETMKAE